MPRPRHELEHLSRRVIYIEADNRAVLTHHARCRCGWESRACLLEGDAYRSFIAHRVRRAASDGPR